MRVENLTKERDMLRQAESRLNREKEAMLAEQRNQNLLLTNLKTIQVPNHTIVFLLSLFFIDSAVSTTAPTDDDEMGWCYIYLQLAAMA